MDVLDCKFVALGCGWLGAEKYFLIGLFLSSEVASCWALMHVYRFNFILFYFNCGCFNANKVSRKF